MNTQDNDPLHAAINAKLRDVVAGVATTPGWYEASQSLSPASTELQRLKVYQTIRDAGVLPDDAGFYLVSWEIDALTSHIAEVAPSEMGDALSAIKAVHGLDEDDFWPPGEAPEEYESLRLKYQAAWDQLFFEHLRHHGEQEMAQLFQADPDGFQNRSDRGRKFFHDADDSEAWLDELGEAVAATMTALSAMGPLAFQCHEEDGLWEVLIYPRPVELVGGAEDGEVVAPAFSLELKELQLLFDQVDSFSWYPFGLSEGEGPNVSIEGSYQGHEVFLQVLAYAPDDEDPGLKVEM